MNLINYSKCIYQLPFGNLNHFVAIIYNDNIMMRRLIKKKILIDYYLLFQFVASTFWSLWFIDRNLVMPKNVDLYFPQWLNHTMHTFVFVFACLEMVTVYRPYPSRLYGLGTHLCFQLSYLIW